ncbi:orotate phosphoribosyltransferase [bacterium]|jgi:orotate phosphoribosyltransferase|nr:orotate phosphoribosyltransferase [bacterium]MBT6831965.1 orotate phosphoribosyltransferase [bacterium]MBT6996661.1 orotate phosphoribosyltransferase [bacterium]MBT7773081.1 orotate phosphoribosyltransferase [bacterium]
MMKYIAEILVRHDIVKTNFETPFVWVSGIHSPIYCDCREIISIPEARDAIVAAFLEKIETENFAVDIISGTATAGIPWAAFVAQALDKPMLYVRPEPKKHGAGKQVEGRGDRGKNVLVVEDALSTAGSSVRSAEALRKELDANVENILAIFSWDTPAAPRTAAAANLKLWPLTYFDEIADTLEESRKITAEQKSELERFHADPPNWWGK